MPYKPLTLEQIDNACAEYLKAAKAFRAEETSEENDRVFDAKLAKLSPKELREVLYQIADNVEIDALSAILAPWDRKDQ